MTESPDRDVLRKAALKVALRVAGACSVLVLCLLTAAMVFILSQPQHTVHRSDGTTKAQTDVDTDDLIGAMVLAGCAGIFLAGGVGWASALSAIRPLGQALALQRRFVQDASHELRTPLAILDARIQL